MSRYWHLLGCGPPPKRVIRTVGRLANDDRGVVCQGIDMPRQEMALRLEETSRTVDTIQHVVSRENVLLLLV